ncbi:MAG: hypothetical protein HC781_18905 [Leptolyngbyaceae cyanobacterium CSU_1_4]|nr:hypothetical protein [Leptolyngbyaceae cyanobacterium CSU_1_4]
MASNHLSALKPDVRSLGSDLRSPSITRFRRGIVIKWMRVILLVISDAVSITSAWWLASLLGTPLASPWHVSHSAQGVTLLPLILAVIIGIVGARGLYKAGNHRRDYLALIKSVSLAEVLLLLIAFLYEPDQTISRSTFLLSWFLTAVFTSAGRFCLDFSTHFLRKLGAVRYSVFLISERENRERHSHLIEQESHYNIIEIADASALDRANRQKTFESLRSLGIVETFVSWQAIHRRLYLCWHFQRAGITLRILPTNWESFFPDRSFKCWEMFPPLLSLRPSLWEAIIGLSVALIFAVGLSCLWCCFRSTLFWQY